MYLFYHNNYPLYYNITNKSQYPHKSTMRIIKNSSYIFILIYKYIFTTLLNNIQYNKTQYYRQV